LEAIKIVSLENMETEDQELSWVFDRAFHACSFALLADFHTKCHSKKSNRRTTWVKCFFLVLSSCFCPTQTKEFRFLEATQSFSSFVFERKTKIAENKVDNFGTIYIRTEGQLEFSKLFLFFLFIFIDKAAFKKLTKIFNACIKTNVCKNAQES
jgi:hypothetical protein